jgi:SAM-dependent methyltransferase
MKQINNSYIGLRSDLLKFIKGNNNIVLDVGCATGTNGKYLLGEGLADSVYGIEFDADMALLAKNNNTKTFCGDLNSLEFINEIVNQNLKFDYILFGDVLEHLINPLKVLLEFKNLLKSDGKIIISLPNIAHVELFVQIYIHGTWPKNSRGIFDSTHLRWFTKKDIFELITETGLKLITYERKLRARDAIGSKFDWKYNLLKMINKDWVTFQYIVVCKKDE